MQSYRIITKRLVEKANNAILEIPARLLPVAGALDDVDQEPARIQCDRQGCYSTTILWTMIYYNILYG